MHSIPAENLHLTMKNDTKVAALLIHLVEHSSSLFIPYLAHPQQTDADHSLYLSEQRVECFKGFHSSFQPFISLASSLEIEDALFEFLDMCLFFGRHCQFLDRTCICFHLCPCSKFHIQGVLFVQQKLRHLDKAKTALFSFFIYDFSFRRLLWKGRLATVARLSQPGLQTAISAHLGRLGSFWGASLDVLEGGVALKHQDSVSFLWGSLIVGLISNVPPCQKLLLQLLVASDIAVKMVGLSFTPHILKTILRVTGLLLLQFSLVLVLFFAQHGQDFIDRLVVYGFLGPGDRREDESRALLLAFYHYKYLSFSYTQIVEVPQAGQPCPLPPLFIYKSNQFGYQPILPPFLCPPSTLFDQFQRFDSFFYNNFIFEMSNPLAMKPKHKSPYKPLLSASKSKLATDLTRKIYLQELPSRRNHPAKSIEQQEARRYHSSSRNMLKDFQLNLNRNMHHSHQKEPFSDRKNEENKKTSITKNDHTGRHSKFGKNKLYSSSSKLDKHEKSTMISTLLSSHQQRQQKLKEDLKRHEEGKNCRVIVIDGNEEIEHFIEVVNMGDILAQLKKEYPKTCYYRSVPVQITLDYLLTQDHIPGQFLNGQSLYLKPASKQTSFDEKESLCLDNFDIIKMIGSGGFSKVFLCRFKKDGQFYAMKVIDKQVIVKNKKKNIIMNERNIMKETTHPFLIQMKFAFETEKFLIFVVEYCPGGELFGLIKRYRRLSEDISRFYIIEIFLGLSYLHQNSIVYRDIKPENILLGQDGHVKIADLGLAKPDMSDGELAYSFCGSPEYMSPQMILQTGHTYPVDFYCMGALLYELLFGLPPFYSRDPNEIYESVLSQDLTFPEDVPISNECRSLLKGLLCKDSKQRLGSIHGVKQILAHPWFGKNAYKNFLQKKISPPITFDSVGKIDLDKFDEKQKKEVDEMLKCQKNENLKFKHEMKNFYHDYRGLTEEYVSRESVNKENKEKLMLRSSSSRRFNTGKYNHLFSGLNRKSSQKELNKTLNSSRK